MTFGTVKTMVFLTIVLVAITLIVMYLIAEPAAVSNLGANTINHYIYK